MIEENPSACEYTVGLAVVYDQMVGKDLRRCVGAARIEWCYFCLVFLLRTTKHVRR